MIASVVLAAAVTVPANAQDLLAQAKAALQAGEADHALALLNSLPSSGAGQAEAHNLECRVRYTLEQWNEAVSQCEQAVRLDGQNSDYHLWLGRALGEKADRASFLRAYSIAKRVPAEFEESVRLNPRNAEALFSLGEFYRQAPGVVGGGVDKAERIAAKLDKVNPSRAHELRGDMAESRKDYDAAEHEFKQAVANGAHPAIQWATLAAFYSRRQRWTEMESALHSALAATRGDKHAAVALYNGAGVLIDSKRDPALAAKLLEDYLTSPGKTEEAPAFVAHYRLASLKEQLGDPAAAKRERAAALALARDYKPAQGASSREARN
ncbi:MAG: tetratricopeptide repeat protein [Terracidiphilus sp.]